MKFYILDNGWETLDKSFFIAGANSGVDSNRNPTNEWIDIPIQAYLVETDAGYILFDTGCDPDWKENWPAFIPEQSPYFVTEEQLLLNRLAQLGVSPDDIRYVVISHLHVDHAGNLHHVPSDIEKIIAAKLNWHLLPNDTKEYHLTDGVTLLNFGSGHSFGMVGMRVDLPKTGRLLIVADAIYCKENVEPEIKVPGILYDSLGYKRTAKYILDYARETGSKILYGHDMAQFKTLVKSHEGCYE